MNLYFFSEKDQTAKVIRSIEVKSFEKVTVPAGTFKAFKIYVRQKGVERIFWYSSELKIYLKKWQKHCRKGESIRELIEYRTQ